MAAYDLQIAMLTRVAEALGEDLRRRVVFVGGCTTSLFVTDSVTRSDVRHTEDVDVIIDLMGRVQWTRFQSDLRDRGFVESMGEELICRMLLDHTIKVDFMPDDEQILGFTNRWYAQGLQTAENHTLPDGVVIRLLTPPLFIATKFEAWLGRGGSAPMDSHDLEDILLLFDGRMELQAELQAADPEIREYISEKVSDLLLHPEFDHFLYGNIRDRGRADLVLNRFRRACTIS